MKLTKRIVVAALIVVCCPLTWVCAGTESTRTPQGDDAGRILWANREQGKPRFIPEEVLRTSDIAALPLTDLQRYELRSEVAEFASGEWKNLCKRALWEGSSQGADPDAVTFLEATRTNPAAFIGQIVAVVPGWGPYGGVAEAAYLKVEEVLVTRDERATPKVGDTVAVLFSGGSVSIEGTRVCRNRAEGFYSPFVGDRILAIGHLSPHDGMLFRDSFRFPIVDDEVVAQPYRALRADQNAIELGSLRQELKVRHGRKTGSG